MNGLQVMYKSRIKPHARQKNTPRTSSMSALVIPEVLKQLRKRHFSCLDRKPNNKERLCLEPYGSYIYNKTFSRVFQL